VVAAVQRPVASAPVLVPSPAIAPAPVAVPAPAVTPAPFVASAPMAARQGVVAGRFVSIENVDAIPYLNDRGRVGYQEWLRKVTPRAFAISDAGHWYATSGTRPAVANLPADPSERALLMCGRAAGKPCRLYAVNGAVVWKAAP
jgi:hypothetical protein